MSVQDVVTEGLDTAHKICMSDKNSKFANKAFGIEKIIDWLSQGK
jgi:hypothetical protein